MRRGAVLIAGAVWFALVGLLGMHVVAGATAGAAPPPAHSAAGPAAPAQTPEMVVSGVGAGVPAPADERAGAHAGGAPAHAALACLVALLVVVALRRHRPAAWLPGRPEARSPARDLALVLSRLSTALRWRTDPVRQAVLLT